MSSSFRCCPIGGSRHSKLISHWLCAHVSQQFHFNIDHCSCTFWNWSYHNNFFSCLFLFFRAAFSGLVIIEEHQQSPPTDKFRVPLVPLVPALSVFLNISLICHLSSMTWARFLFWMIIGKTAAKYFIILLVIQKSVLKKLYYFPRLTIISYPRIIIYSYIYI